MPVRQMCGRFLFALEVDRWCGRLRLRDWSYLMEDYDAGTQYAQEQYYYERDKELADLRAQLEQAREG